ncbi:unnamed protein product [Prunus brigantina]
MAVTTAKLKTNPEPTLRRRNQVFSMEGNHEQELEGLEHFQMHVADRLKEPKTPNTSRCTSRC